MPREWDDFDDEDDDDDLDLDEEPLAAETVDSLKDKVFDLEQELVELKLALREVREKERSAAARAKKQDEDRKKLPIQVATVVVVLLLAVAVMFALEFVGRWLSRTINEVVGVEFLSSIFALAVIVLTPFALFLAIALTLDRLKARRGDRS